jgi:hypothetical protein
MTYRLTRFAKRGCRVVALEAAGAARSAAFRHQAANLFDPRPEFRLKSDAPVGDHR